MPNPFEELKKLKITIETIMGAAPAKADRSGLADTSLAKQIFVPDLLPDYIKSEDKVASPEELKDYSDKALRAIWNITHYASQGYMKAIIHRGAIDESFNFLDSTWVPKIVDNNTYQAGIALQSALDVLLTEEGLNEFPSVFHDSIKSSLINLKSTLDNRIKVYVAHRPETVNANIEHLNYTSEQVTKWKERFNEINRIEHAINQFGVVVSDSSNKELSPSDIPVLEQKLKEIEELDKQYQIAIDTFKEFNESWNSSNLERPLPDSIKVSEFVVFLAKREQYQKANAYAMLDSYSKLYNSDNPQLRDEAIASRLAYYYKKGKSLVKDTKAVNSVMFNSGLLQKRLIDARELEGFEKKLQEIEALPEIPGENTQELIQKIETQLQQFREDIDAFGMQKPGESKMEKDGAEQQKKFTAASSALMQQLNEHLKQLTLQKESLLARMQPFTEEDFLPGYDPAFERASSQSKERLDKRLEGVQQQIDAINDVIQKVHRNVEHMKDVFAKASIQGRQAQLAVSGQRVQSAFNQYHLKSRPKSYSMQFDLNRFTHSTYTDAVKSINNEFNPQILIAETALASKREQIADRASTLTALQDKGAARKKFLTEALVGLQQYHDELLNHSGIYLPWNKEQIKQLKGYLEGNEKIGSYIDTLHNAAVAGTSWGGMNLSNLSNLSRHYTSVLGPSEFDLDIEDILEYISDKIELINAELDIDITAKETSEAANKKHLLGAENLWELRKQRQQVQQDKTRAEEELSQQRGLLGQLVHDKEEQLTAWAERLKAKEHSFAVTNLEYQTNLLEHGVAMLAHALYQLEYKLDDINQKQPLLDEISTVLDSMSDEEGLRYFSSIQDKMQINRFSHLMEQQESRNDSPNYLRKTISDALAARKKEMGQLEEQGRAVISVPPELKDKIGRLDNEIKGLEEKLARLEKIVAAATKNDEAKAALIDEKVAMKQLNVMQNVLETRFAPLLEALYYPANAQEGVDLLAAINKFKTEDLTAFSQIKFPDNPSLNRQHQEIKELLKDLDFQEKHLINWQLDRIKKESDVLIKVYSSIDKSKRVGLADKVSAFLDNNNALLHRLESTDDSEIQKKLQALAPNIRKVEFIQNALNVDTSLLSPRDQLEQLHEKYFGSKTEQGVFENYLTERAQQFWFRDWCQSIAAFALSCFSVTTDEEERSRYIKRLSAAMGKYREDGDVKPLLQEIDNGLQQFPPRAQFGEGYSKSLHCKLESLKDELMPILLEIEIKKDEEQEEKDDKKIVIY